MATYQYYESDGFRLKMFDMEAMEEQLSRHRRRLERGLSEMAELRAAADRIERKLEALGAREEVTP